MKRRTLLKYLTLHSITLPFLLQAEEEISNKSSTTHKRLVLIELKGGNDGLNTVIPYKDPLYYKLRPNIALNKSEVLPINEQLAFHPSMKEMKEIFDKDELAIIQGVGYPNPNRSHFRSIEILDTASNSQEYLDNGWLNTLTLAKTYLPKGVILGGEYGPLSGNTKGIIKINNIKGFLQKSKQIKGRISLTGNNDALLHLLETEAEIRNSADVLKKSLTESKALPIAFQKSNFGKQMHTTTELINSTADIPFFKVSLGSFDTHTNQPKKHARLLKELSEGIATMRKNLIESGEWENTIIMTYSEFGRRAAENASKGTDHGTAAPHFIVGGKVKGGIYGNHPSLKNLDKNDDLIYTTDFRSLYQSIVQDWFKVSSTILQPFSPIEHLNFNSKRNYISSSKPIIPTGLDSSKNTKVNQSTNRPSPSFIHYLLQ